MVDCLVAFVYLLNVKNSLLYKIENTVSNEKTEGLLSHVYSDITSTLSMISDKIVQESGLLKSFGGSSYTTIDVKAGEKYKITNFKTKKYK